MSNYPLLNLFWTMLEFFLWILWLFLLFKIITDIFRDHSMSGWGKAGWLILVILLPFVGVLAYVIIRGGSMARRDREQVEQADAAFKQYVREAAGPTGANAASSHVDELGRLADLRTSGAISEEEFQRAKDKLLS
ncbi:SHOCT domain-containing protein [Streptacidiphilus sp. 4-A2]|nr:SHOCT domain-containing protein [Streptacidiphilus sp. 4-A2]